MKALNFFGHPVFLCAAFLLVLISGEAYGGPYLLYLILGLTHGTSYALFGIAGMLLTLVSLTGRNAAINCLLIVLGLLLMTLSLCQFFSGERLHYNWASFEQTIPVLSFGLFGFAGLSSLIKAGVVFRSKFSRYRRRPGTLNRIG